MPKINQRKSKRAHGGKRRNAGRKPGSRNKVTVLIKASLAETAKAYTAEMLGVLIEIANNDKLSPNARAVAAQAVLDRGHGKPTQSHEHTGKDGGPIATEDKTPHDELDTARRIAFVLARAALKEKPDG
jgi:hypothetical protein